MRTLYSVLFYLIVPLIFLRLVWRSIKAPGYNNRWGERFACYRGKYRQGVVWFHAVSVGESEALFPLVRRFQAKFPERRILVTTTTPTGSARVLATMGDSVDHVYLPYDLPDAVSRFLASFKPVLAVIVETEIWPNLFGGCGKHNIPLYLINARLSEKSARGYRKIPLLVHPTLANLKNIAAQTQEDAERFLAIGALSSQVSTIGNIKFDLEIADEILIDGKKLKTSVFDGRFVLLAASTHKGEEQVLLDAYKALKPTITGLLLIIVPRHPERFAEVTALCEQNRLNVVRRTSKKPCLQETDVYVADTMGELKLFYAAADLAFIGGSLLPVGGHNLLEASAIGVPVLFGPYMANFKDIANKVLTQDAAIQCNSKEELVKTIQHLYSDPDRRNTLVENGQHFVLKNRGATDKLCEILFAEMDS